MTYSRKKNNEAVSGESGVTSHATIINKVFDAFRKSHHYSIRKQKPELYKSVLLKTQDIPIDILIKSYDIYITVKGKDNKIPHPNYYLKVALNSVKELKKNPEHKPIWGKMI